MARCKNNMEISSNDVNKKSSGQGTATAPRKAVKNIERRNERERRRVQIINEAFESLLCRIPNENQESRKTRVSKLKIALSAIDYIHELDKNLMEAKKMVNDIKQCDSNVEQQQQPESLSQQIQQQGTPQLQIQQLHQLPVQHKFHQQVYQQQLQQPSQQLLLQNQISPSSPFQLQQHQLLLQQTTPQTTTLLNHQDYKFPLHSQQINQSNNSNSLGEYESPCNTTSHYSKYINVKSENIYDFGGNVF